MPITWSRLHEVLGLSQRELKYSDVVAAVEMQIPEDSALDWKADRPDIEPHRVELGKDVAAMANSGGGTIVYGVREEGADKTLACNDIDLSDQGEQQIRSIVWQRVRPVVGGIEVLRIENPENPGYGAMAISVPASPDAPHFYEKNGQPPAAPWRNGPHTENLREREIERAYRDRFTRQEVTHTALDRLIAGLSPRLRFDGWAARWCVVASHPVGNVPLGVPPSTSEQVCETITAAASKERALAAVNPTDLYGVVVSNLNSTNPRRGLRRWILRFPWNREQDGGDTASAYAELYEDGSMVFAYPASDPDGPDAHGRTVLAAATVESVTIGAVVLSREWQRARSITGPTLMRATVLIDPENVAPTWVYGRQSYGLSNHTIPAWTTPVHTFEPVDVLLDARPAPDTNLDAIIELAQGILHQFEYEVLEKIKATEV